MALLCVEVEPEGIVASEGSNDVSGELDEGSLKVSPLLCANTAPAGEMMAIHSM